MAADRDEQLAALLDDLARQQRRGQAPDLDAVTRDNPDLADELRQLWAAAQLADALGRSAGSTLDHEPSRRSPSQPVETVALPRAFGDYVLLRELGRGG